MEWGDIASFSAINAGTTPIVASIIVTPSANGCAGTPRTVTITVNPTPSVTVDSVVQPDAPAPEAMERLFTRANPRGFDEEIWRHSFGCRGWLVMSRHRATHEITAIRAVGPEALP